MREGDPDANVLLLLSDEMEVRHQAREVSRKEASGNEDCVNGISPCTWFAGISLPPTSGDIRGDLFRSMSLLLGEIDLRGFSVSAFHVFLTFEFTLESTSATIPVTRYTYS